MTERLAQEEATIQKMLAMVPSPAREKVKGILNEYSKRYGGALSSVDGEVAKALEAALKKGAPEVVRNVLSEALKGQGEGLQKKSGSLSADAFFGQLFVDNWKQFFENHKEEYNLFLKTNSTIGDTEQVRKQWAAAWMVYRMARYGGTMGVNFKYVHERAGVKSAVDIPPSVRDDASIHGKAFSFIMKDILYGSRYRDSSSKQDYVTFGDCDEVSLMMAQMLQSISNKSNLGMDPMVYRLASSHAGVGVSIGGKWFYLEPSLYQIQHPKNLEKELKENLALEGFSALDKKLMREALSSMSKGRPPTSIFRDQYESITARQLEAVLKKKAELWPNWDTMPSKERDVVRTGLSLPPVSSSQQEMISAAAKAAVNMSPEEAIIRREASRRRWGYNFESISFRLEKSVLPKVLKEPAGTKKAVSMLTDLAASSLEGEYRRNFEELTSIMGSLTDIKKINILTDMVTEMKNTRYSMSEARKRFGVA